MSNLIEKQPYNWVHGIGFSIKFKKKNSNPLGTVPTEQSITDYYDIFKKETATIYWKYQTWFGSLKSTIE